MTERILQLNREKHIFWTFFSILLLSAGFYMYCVKATISNIVIRQNLENEASALTLSIGSQEFTYITKTNAVTLPLAYSLGFKDASVKTYVPRNPDTKVAFLSN